MSDLIDRQREVEHLMGIIEATNQDSDYNKGWIDGLEYCISTMSVAPSAQPEPYLDSIVSEIEKTINETKKSGKHHEIHIRINGEMICFGLRLALEIIEEKRNERHDIQTGCD